MQPFGLCLQHLGRSQGAKERVALYRRTGYIPRGREVEPHVGFRTVSGYPNARVIHLSQRVLGVRVAVRRCQFQPPCRVLVILNHARALAQRIAKLVLGIGAAVLGRTFQPLLRVPLVAFHSVSGRIQVGKLVFGDGVIALGARLFYNENYVAWPMRHHAKLDQSTTGRDVVEYGWRTGERWNTLRAETVGAARPLVDGSEAEFITEHYWGYAMQRDGGTVEYRVEHPRWLVWEATAGALDCDVRAVYGAEFVEALRGEPSSAFVAVGSAITVRRGVRIA